MTALADAVLPLIRTRGELYRWGAANAHGRQMQEAIDILEATLPATDAGDAYQVSHKALASAIKVTPTPPFRGRANRPSSGRLR